MFGLCLSIFTVAWIVRCFELVGYLVGVFGCKNVLAADEIKGGS